MAISSYVVKTNAKVICKFMDAKKPYVVIYNKLKFF